MHYVSAEGLGKSYGIQPLFQNITFHIQEGDRIALVARNGTGKSTLLRILSGRETPDSGNVWINREITVALLEQDPVFLEDNTVLDNIFHHNNAVMNTVRQYEAACDENDVHAINEAIVKMDEADAWDFDARVKQILTRLNIHGLRQPVSALSGGQRKRVALARTLVDIGFGQRHVLLIMDEPTNHLDIEMVEWLEHYIAQQNVTLLLVTHDRYFLDAVCTEIWELEYENLYVYKGNYENFMEKKAARVENDLAAVDKAKNIYRRELEWMRRQPQARTTKSKSRIDAFYDVEKKARQRLDDTELALQSKMSRLGGKVLELKKVNKSYGDKVILKGFDYIFKKGERIGITGKNGTGKSTFVNMLQGLEEPDSGKVNIGETIVFGNYSQQGLQVKEDMRVIEYVKTMAERFPLANGGALGAAQFLQLFLFDPDKQFTYISKLSGGEKRRLHLLSILFRNPNFIVLDEPTNDLDLPTLSVLENFLMEFGGCLVVISHDRYFMDRLVDHLFVFEGDGFVRDFPGNYSQYRQWLLLQEKEEQRPPAREQIEETVSVNKPERRLSYKEKRELQQLKNDIEALEREKRTITEQLNGGALPFDRLQELSLRIGAVSALLDEKEMRWLELSELPG